MKTIKNSIIRGIDLFGQNILLNFKDSDNYQSVIGGLTSFAIVLVLAIFFWSSILSFILKENLTAITETIFSNNPDQITLQKSSYMMALSIEQTNFTTNPYFNITLEQRQYERQADGSLVKKKVLVNLVPCTLEHFQSLESNQDFEKQFNQLALNTWLCPELGFQLQLEGTYSSTWFDFIKIVVSQCSNERSPNQFLTWAPTCAPQAELDAHLKKEGQFKFQLYSTNSLINPSQTDNFIQKYLDDEMYFTFVPKQLSRQANIYYRKYQIDIDHSLIPLEDHEQQELYIRQPSDYRDLTEVGRTTDDSYAIVYLRRSSFDEHIYRSYQKVTDLLSYLGGFLQILVVFFGFFIAFYNKFQLFIDLSNQMFDFSERAIHIEPQIDTKLNVQHIDGNKEALEELIKPDKSQGSIELPTKIQLKTPQNQEERNPIFQDQTKSIYQGLANQAVKRRKATCSICLMFSTIVRIDCCQSKDSRLFIKAQDSINKQLNVQTILKKLNEIDQIKNILLTEDQQLLFNIQQKQQIGQNCEQSVIPNQVNKFLKQATKIGKSQICQSNDQKELADRIEQTYERVVKQYSDSDGNEWNIADRINKLLMAKFDQEYPEKKEQKQHNKVSRIGGYKI